MARSNDAVSVPLRYPTAAIFVDESGSKSTAGGQFFVVAAVKTRYPERLARTIREVRDRTGYSSELKFSSITRGSLIVYYELIAALRLATAFDRPGLVDGREARVNIATYRGKGGDPASLKVVNRSVSAS